MELIHENQEPLANIAVDLMEIEAGTSLMTGGGAIFTAGAGFDVTVRGAVVGVPANAAGAGLAVTGAGLTAHGAHELGKDVRNLRMHSEASGTATTSATTGPPPVTVKNLAGDGILQTRKAR